MISRTAPTIALAFTLLLAGCSAAGSAAGNAADAARQRVLAEASAAAGGVVQSQICALAGDGKLSSTDLSSLADLLQQAQAAGVPADVLGQVKAVVNDTATRTADLKELQKTCAAKK